MFRKIEYPGRLGPEEMVSWIPSSIRKNRAMPITPRIARLKPMPERLRLPISRIGSDVHLHDRTSPSVQVVCSTEAGNSVSISMVISSFEIKTPAKAKIRKTKSSSARSCLYLRTGCIRGPDGTPYGESSLALQAGTTHLSLMPCPVNWEGKDNLYRLPRGPQRSSMTFIQGSPEFRTSL